MKLQHLMIMRRVDAACERMNAGLIVVAIVLSVVAGAVATIRLSQAAAEMSGRNLSTYSLEDGVTQSAASVQ
jgi:hypothetical protein